MNQHKHTSDLHIGRGWLNRAAEVLDACEDHVSTAEFAHAAAVIGTGFVTLAHAEQAAAAAAEVSQVRSAILSLADEPTLAAAAVREEQAADEARPHDDAYLASTPWDHAVDCQGDCEQPGKVPCGADEVIPDVVRHVHADADVPCKCAIPPSGGQEHLPPCPAFIAAREAGRG